VLIIRIWFQITTPIPAIGGTYTEGLVGTPRFINPLLAPGNHVDRDLSSLVFSGLMRVDTDGALVPDLAKEVRISDDKKIYTFTLRDNLIWHDGEPLTADDIVYTISSIKDPAFKSPLRVSFSGVDVKRIDDKTVSFTLPQPFPSFLEALTVGIIPQHLWYSIPPAQASLAEANIRPVGSGPYIFKMVTKDTAGSIRSMTLTRNTKYHGTVPRITELTFKFYPDFETAFDALKNKNVDGLGSAPLDAKSDLEKNRSVQLKNLIIPQYNALFFNPEKNPVLKDAALRKALALGIDRDRIIREALQDSGNVVDTPLILNAPSSHEGRMHYGYDPNAAGKLLDDAGWKVDETTKLRNKDKAELTIALTSSDQQENATTAAIIKENWEALGIKVDLQIIDKTKIKKERIEPREYQVLLFGQILVSNQDAYAFWHSSQYKNPGNNLSVLGNKDIDAALEQLRNTNDPAVQTELYKKFETKLTNEVFAIFLYNPTYLYPLGKNVRGADDLKHIAMPSDRFNGITHWYVATKRRFK
jgi:peptide/nickel transport system substrate-binding protein